LNVKPAVGFTLPSAGVTPAPDGKKRCRLRPVRRGWSRKSPRVRFLGHPERSRGTPAPAARSGHRQKSRVRPSVLHNLWILAANPQRSVGSFSRELIAKTPRW